MSGGKPLSVMMVVPAFPTASETFIANKARALIDSGVSVRILAHSVPDEDDSRFGTWPAGTVVLSPLAERFSAVRRANSLVLRKPLGAGAIWRQVCRLEDSGSDRIRAWLRCLPFVTGDYDIVHFEFSGVAVEYLDALPLIKQRALVAVSCRGAAERITPHNDPNREQHLRAVFEESDLIHCVSEDMKQTAVALGAPASKIFVNRPAIDVHHFQRIARDRPADGPIRVLSTGSLHWRKGYPYALQAVRAVLNNGLAIDYRILGSGPEEEQMRFTIHDLDLERHVLLLGSQPPPRVKDELAAADIFLLPSLSEGLSNAALEAMAMELPVISTDVAGMPEAISNGVEGLLVRPRAPAEIAACLIKLINDPQLRARMGAAGRQRVEAEFNLQRQAQCFVDAYRGLVEKAV